MPATEPLMTFKDLMALVDTLDTDKPNLPRFTSLLKMGKRMVDSRQKLSEIRESVDNLLREIDSLSDG